jgi:hypothetical protein
MNNQKKFNKAIINMNYDKIKELILLPDVDPCDNDNLALFYIAENGNLQLIKLILSHKSINPSISDNFAIQQACQYGKTQIVEHLLKDKRVTPTCWGLLTSAQQGYFDIVSLLIKDDRVNLIFDSNYAIISAFENGMDNVVNLLWSFKKVKESLKIDDNEIYNELSTKNIKEKMEHF